MNTAPDQPYSGPMTTSAITEHRISWFVYAGREKIRHTAGMRGQWGYDVECSCGWKTTTGGAIKRYVADQVWAHKRGFTPAS